MSPREIEITQFRGVHMISNTKKAETSFPLTPREAADLFGITTKEMRRYGDPDVDQNGEMWEERGVGSYYSDAKLAEIADERELATLEPTDNEEMILLRSDLNTAILDVPWTDVEFMREERIRRKEESIFFEFGGETTDGRRFGIRFEKGKKIVKFLPKDAIMLALEAYDEPFEPDDPFLQSSEE